MRKFVSTFIVTLMVVFLAGAAELSGSTDETPLAQIENKLIKTLKEHGMSEDTITEVLKDVKPELRKVIVGGASAKVSNNNLSGVKGMENGSNTFYGQGAGAGVTIGSGNSFFGVEAGYNNASGADNTFLGHQAGYGNTAGNGNVFLGYKAGYNETGSDKLYIDNSDTDNPLIYGEFDSNKVTINGELEVVRETEAGKITARQGNGATAILAAGTNYGFFGTQSENDLRILANDSPKMTITTSGNVGIGTTSPIYTLTVTGSGGSNAGSTGGPWIAGSSREYKENIRELSSMDAMEALKELTPVRYNYKKSDEEYLGFIAEDVPALVAMNNRKGMNSMDVVAVLTKVLQEMQKRDLDRQKTISELSKKYQDKQKTISELNKRISELEKK